MNDRKALINEALSGLHHTGSDSKTYGDIAKEGVATELEKEFAKQLGQAFSVSFAIKLQKEVEFAFKYGAQSIPRVFDLTPVPKVEYIEADTDFEE